jgi:hypothetical protein
MTNKIRGQVAWPLFKVLVFPCWWGYSLGVVLRNLSFHMIIWVNAQLSVSISVEIMLPISQYKIFLNDSNGHGCYFF